MQIPRTDVRGLPQRQIWSEQQHGLMIANRRAAIWRPPTPPLEHEGPYEFAIEVAFGLAMTAVWGRLTPSGVGAAFGREAWAGDVCSDCAPVGFEPAAGSGGETSCC
jgi:hypothetical protein